MSRRASHKKSVGHLIPRRGDLRSKITKSDLKFLNSVGKGITFDQPREDSVFSIKSVMTLLMSGNPRRNKDSLGEEFTRLKVKYPDWLNIAQDLVITLFPTFSDEERLKIIQDKLIAPFEKSVDT